MPLCKYCKLITVERIFTENYLKHFPNFSDILVSRHTCALCDLLAKRCDEFVGDGGLQGYTQLALVRSVLPSGNGRIYPVIIDDTVGDTPEFVFGLTDDSHPGVIVRTRGSLISCRL